MENNQYNPRVEGPPKLVENLDVLWSRFYSATQEIIVNYGPVIVYYVKATHPRQWQDFVGNNFACWSEVEVLSQIVRQRKCLDSVGADKDIYKFAKQLEDWYVIKPRSKEEKLKFYSVATEFVEQLPIVDLFPIKLSEKPTQRASQMHKLCGPFYSLKRKLDMPKKWFAHYGNRFKEEAEKVPKKRTLNTILNEALDREHAPLESDSDEDEFHLRHVLSGEPMDVVLESLKRKRDYRCALRGEPERFGSIATLSRDAAEDQPGTSGERDEGGEPSEQSERSAKKARHDPTTSQTQTENGSDVNNSDDVGSDETNPDLDRAGPSTRP